MFLVFNSEGFSKRLRKGIFPVIKRVKGGFSNALFGVSGKTV
jgi:hypothetical protein